MTKYCDCGGSYEYISKHECPNGRRNTEHPKYPDYTPYHEAEIYGVRYWDYSIKINGVIYEVSVNRTNGGMYINKDENQGG